MSGRNTFHKEERLKSRKLMEALFAKGKSKTSFPLRMQFMEVPEKMAYPAQAMFVVPKRSFKKAHDRNKLKRRMREAYRLQKNELYAKLAVGEKYLVLAFLYTAKKSEDFEVIQKSLELLLQKLK